MTNCFNAFPREQNKTKVLPRYPDHDHRVPEQYQAINGPNYMHRGTVYCTLLYLTVLYLLAEDGCLRGAMMRCISSDAARAY